MTRLKIEILSEAEKEKIHRSAVTLLEKMGYLCNHPEVLEAFRQAGCTVGDELAKPKGARIVRFTEAIIGDALMKCPSQFTLYPIAPGYREVKWGSGEVYFGATGGNMTWDLETGELRDAMLSDFVTGSRLIDACDNFDVIFGCPYFWIYDVARMDESEKYGLIGALMTGVTMLHCGKAQNRVYFTSTEQELTDTLYLWQIAAGGKAAFRGKPTGSICIAPMSPYSLLGRLEPGGPLDWADWLVVIAKAGGPPALLGLNAPMSVAGCIVEAVTEFLAINVAIQVINPGNPVILGEYAGSVDMTTGAKAASRPEAMLMRLGIREMARYYNKPSFFYVQSDAPMADSQAAWERMGIYLMAAQAGVDLTMSGGGLAEGDVCCPQQILIDNEIIGWVRHLVKGFDVSEETIPLDLMMKTGFGALGATFLGTAHTRRLYRTQMWQRSSLTNAFGRAAWLEHGKKTLLDRATERAREILQKHQPNIPETLQREIREYLLQVMKREGVRDDEIKRIMEQTYR